jgi:ABC-type nitrate/sulfonate/bicarbonate transport system substrate-binding protein
MRINTPGAASFPPQDQPLRVGFVPVSDCAPVVMARELGLYERYGLEVVLQREISWANVCHGIVSGALDAAHAPAALPFIASNGLESEPCPCVTGLVLSLQGSAIAISRRLWERGVHDATTLRTEIRQNQARMTYTFGVDFAFSAQHFLLRQWLQSAAINPDAEVRVVCIPPAQMFPTLKLGYIDGFCVGEPWASVAIQAQVGACVSTSADLAPLHPDKVLMVRRTFAETRADVHERLIAALIEACAYCDNPENRKTIGAVLAQPRYVNAPPDCLQAGLVGSFNQGPAGTQNFLDLNIFHRHDANNPSRDKAAWVRGRLSELLAGSESRGPFYRRHGFREDVFRHAIFERAKAILSSAQVITSAAEKHQSPPLARKLEAVAKFNSS